MSIIHDALKKVQQEQSTKPSLFSASQETQDNQAGEGPIEYLKSEPKNKAGSPLSVIGALVFIVLCFFFLYRQLNSTFPNLFGSLKVSALKLIHKEPLAPPKPTPLPPLARITVMPSPKPVVKAIPPPVTAAPKGAPAPLNAGPTPAAPSMAGAIVPAATDATPVVNSPVTLNIHGVMANGKSNLVLINDQVYQEGDEPVEGVKILKISLDSITVDENGRQEKIRVNN